MTENEFWQVLDGSGLTGGERDYERILNIISAFLGNDAKCLQAAGYINAAEYIAKESNYIYDYLDAKGYYKNVDEEVKEPLA